MALCSAASSASLLGSAASLAKTVCQIRDGSEKNTFVVSLFTSILLKDIKPFIICSHIAYAINYQHATTALKNYNFEQGNKGQRERSGDD